jgi:multidrug efflux pump
MSRLFIDRPIFALVLAIVAVLLGIGALGRLPIAQYPDVAPPQVSVRAANTGASADVLASSVTQVLERQLTGIDGLLYFQSSSTARGEVRITVTFDKGTDPDIAQVQVQNKVQQAISRLPLQVQQQGVTVTKGSPDFLMIVGVYDSTDKSTNFDVSDWLTTNMQDDLSRVPGVSDVNVFGSSYAMRIWLDPHKLSGVGLMPSDVISAIQTQNTEVAAGEVGGLPAPEGQLINATVTANSRLQTPEQFRNIILKADPSGARVLIGDVARVEIGADSYAAIIRVNGHPGAGMGIFLEPGANALTTASLVKAKVEQIARSMPPGYQLAYANDSSDFIKLSIREVVKTLLEAVLLVVLVIFIFLQSWRATFIPFIAVPVVLLSTFAVFFALGYSINTMTLFGLVLATGLLVDDAIVVVENVERIMDDNPGMTPREAALQSMGQIQTALVAIALVLSAVFLPMIFFGGSTGVIYRQFAITIVSAMILSVLAALILSPTIAANLMKRSDGNVERSYLGQRMPGLAHRIEGWRVRFNSVFDRFLHWYVGSIPRIVGQKARTFGVYGVIFLLLLLLFYRLPTGFLPVEDQGQALVQFRLPAGATMTRTRQVQDQIENYFLKGPDAKNVKTYFTVAGGGQGAAGQNSGQAYINFVGYDDRKGSKNSADAIVARASAALRKIRDAQVYALVPGAIRGLGQSTGFTMELQNIAGLSDEQFADARDQLLAQANANPRLASVRQSELPDVASLKIDIDENRVAALGLNAGDVNTTLSTAWGGRYVNDFIDRGRVKRVYVQGDAQYRSEPDDVTQWYVRNRSGAMVPFSSFAQTSWQTTPTSLSRFLGYPSYEIQGQGAPGVSSGQAMNEIAAIADQIPGIGVAWAGQSYQERLSSGQAPILYAISLLFVFLCLAALYESWSIPFAVLLVVPLGLIGAVLLVTLRGLENDVYLQLGLITTMGLSAKNAILMVEFAETAEKKGMRAIDAAIEAARIRLRPILMTSMAFIFGVVPLAVATGAGAHSRVAIGTAVIGGMISATFLALFFIPFFFVMVVQGSREGLGWIKARWRARQGAQE